MTISEFLDHLRVAASSWRGGFAVERSGRIVACFAKVLGPFPVYGHTVTPTGEPTRRRIKSAMDDDLACDPELRASILDAVGLA